MAETRTCHSNDVVVTATPHFYILHYSIPLPILSSSNLPQFTFKPRYIPSFRDKKAMKAKKGSVAVLVGLLDDDQDNDNDNDNEAEGGLHKFLIPISHLYHPSLQSLLDQAHEIYGYPAAGPLRLPCSLDDFLHLTWTIEREAGSFQMCQRGSSGQLYHYHHLPFHRSLSCTSC